MRSAHEHDKRPLLLCRCKGPSEDAASCARRAGLELRVRATGQKPWPPGRSKPQEAGPRHLSRAGMGAEGA
eukprot:8520982-Heterocapsa_arctica.AAC.1